jgi:rod shape-determining protein MreD
VKPAAVLLVVVIAVVLQAALARFTAGAEWGFDLVLVAVVYASLQSGPVAGMLAGTLGGLLQDLLASGIVGVGGLAKTLVGCATGAIGTQFVVARPWPRTAIVAGATVVHRLLVLALYGLIEQHWPVVPWTAILVETGVNALAGLIAFQAGEGLPGALARGRVSRRSSLSRRQW